MIRHHSLSRTNHSVYHHYPPQPRQCALLLSCLFTLQICSQQQLWRWSVERTYANVWKSLPFSFLPCCVFKGLFHTTYYSPAPYDSSLVSMSGPWICLPNQHSKRSSYRWCFRQSFKTAAFASPLETSVLCSVTNIFAVPCPSQKLTVFMGVLCLPVQVCTLTTEWSFVFKNLSFVTFIRDKNHFCYSVFDLELI